MLSLAPYACNPQVLYRSDQFFIYDSGSGHTFPTTRQHVSGRFGEPFAAAVEQTPGVWVNFDPDARADAVQLPSIHPGVPGHHRMGMPLLIRAITPTTIRVELSDRPSKVVVLPRKHAMVSTYIRWITRRIEGTTTINWDIHTVDLPVWLYRRIREEFMEGGAA